MKKTKAACLMAFSMMLVVQTSQVSVAGGQDVTIVNKTGVKINAVCMSPIAVNRWEEYLPGEDTISNGELFLTGVGKYR